MRGLPEQTAEPRTATADNAAHLTPLHHRQGLPCATLSTHYGLLTSPLLQRQGSNL